MKGSDWGVILTLDAAPQQPKQSWSYLKNTEARPAVFTFQGERRRAPPSCTTLSSRSAPILPGEKGDKRSELKKNRGRAVCWKMELLGGGCPYERRWGPGDKIFIAGAEITWPVASLGWMLMARPPLSFSFLEKLKEYGRLQLRIKDEAPFVLCLFVWQYRREWKPFF